MLERLPVQKFGRHKVPTVREVAGPGMTIKEHYIGELDHQGLGGHIDNPAFLGVMFTGIRSLSSLLVPNMGVVHFAACRAHPTDDMIALIREEVSMPTVLSPNKGVTQSYRESNESGWFAGPLSIERALSAFGFLVPNALWAFIKSTILPCSLDVFTKPRVMHDF